MEVCKVCGKEFETPQQLMGHMNRMHGGKNGRKKRNWKKRKEAKLRMEDALVGLPGGGDGNPGQVTLDEAITVLETKRDSLNEVIGMLKKLREVGR